MPTLKVSPSKINLGGKVNIQLTADDGETLGGTYTISIKNDSATLDMELDTVSLDNTARSFDGSFDTTGHQLGKYTIGVKEGANEIQRHEFDVVEPLVHVSLKSEATPYTKDQIVWMAIRGGAKSASYSGFNTFVENLFSDTYTAFGNKAIENSFKYSHIQPSDYGWQNTYPFIKAAATLYMERAKIKDAITTELVGDEKRRIGDGGINESQLKNDLVDYLGSTVPTELSSLPYLQRVIQRVSSELLKSINESTGVGNSRITGDFTCEYLRQRLQRPPMYDLIWSYWMSLAGLTETMNAVVDCYRRKSNERTALLSDVRFDLLRPIGNLLSGYARDTEIPITHEEYLVELQAQYGLMLPEHAELDIQGMQSDTSFLGALHNVIGGSGKLLRDRLNKTLDVDTHSLGRILGNMNVRLAMGAHNQLWEVTRRIRRDMLVQQWILSRPEVTEFLRVPAMVDMREGWMSALAAYRDRKNQQSRSASRSGNYGSVSGNSSQSALVVQQFHRLACKSEIMVLGARWGGWSNEDMVGKSAEGWLNEVQHDIKDYISDYREVTRLVNLDVETADPQALALREMQPLQFLGSQAGGTAARQLMTRAAPQLTSQPQVKLLQRRMANRQERSGVLKRLPVFKITD